MQFQVPQFIDVEDRIFGPLTLKQFIYLVGGGATIFLLFIFLPFILFVILAIPVGAFALALAFYKVNNQPFIKILENALGHYAKSKIYTWEKKEKKKKLLVTDDIRKTNKPIEAPKLTLGKLEDLSWSLDIKDDLDR